MPYIIITETLQLKLLKSEDCCDLELYFLIYPIIK